MAYVLTKMAEIFQFLTLNIFLILQDRASIIIVNI